MDLAPLIADVARHTKAIAKLKKRIAAEEEKLKIARVALLAPFESICSETASEYNSLHPEASYTARFNVQGFAPELNPTTIHLWMVLKDTHRREPVEEFVNEEEFAPIQKIVAPIFNRRLREAGISLTLGTLLVPWYYYIK